MELLIKMIKQIVVALGIICHSNLKPCNIYAFCINYSYGFPIKYA